jgi:hypothetical protein
MPEHWTGEVCSASTIGLTLDILSSRVPSAVKNIGSIWTSDAAHEHKKQHSDKYF